MDPLHNNLHNAHFVPHLDCDDKVHKITMHNFTAVKTSHLILHYY